MHRALLHRLTLDIRVLRSPYAFVASHARLVRLGFLRALLQAPRLGVGELDRLVLRNSVSAVVLSLMYPSPQSAAIFTHVRRVADKVLMNVVVGHGRAVDLLKWLSACAHLPAFTIIYLSRLLELLAVSLHDDCNDSDG